MPLISRNGVPQSKRFGFVEFKHHAYAMAALRTLNASKNCLDFLPDAQRQLVEATPITVDKLVVDFTVENVKKVRIIKKRAENNLAAVAQVKGGAAPVKGATAQSKAKEVEEDASKKGKRKRSGGDESDHDDESDPDDDDDGDDGDDGDTSGEDGGKPAAGSGANKQQSEKFLAKKKEHKLKRKAMLDKRREKTRLRKEAALLKKSKQEKETAAVEEKKDVTPLKVDGSKKSKKRKVIK